MTQEVTLYRTENVDGMMRLGSLLAQSGYFTDSREAAQAVTKMMAGAELGFGPIASMTGINIIKGKVTLSANLIAAAIKRSGRYNYRVRKMTDSECEIVFYEGKEEIGVSTFTAKDAANAGLMGENWRKFPRNMLFARAISNGAKWYCPDLSGGPLYTPDELGVVVDGETGEVIDAPAPPRVVEAWPNAQAQPANGNGHATPPPSDLPGFEVWADWSRPDHAIAWGMAQGVFDHQRHAENAYAKVKTASNPTNARAMWAAWYLDVQRRIAERDAGSSDRPADPDGWDDIDAHGVELPQFN